MPEVRVPVDLETVLVGALEQDATFAPLVGGVGNAAKISTRLPSSFRKEERLKLNRTPGGGAVGWPDHIERALVDFHAYGEDDTGAWAVAAGLVVAMARLEGSIVAGGVITACERTLGPGWLPDPDAGDAPRYLMQYAITAHPA